MAMQAPLRVELGTLGDAQLIAVAGEADLSTSARFTRKLLGVAEAGDKRIVLDLLELGFMDSTMVHALLSATPQIRRNGGDMAIVCTDENVCRILQITAVDGVYRVVKTHEEALAALGLGAPPSA